MPRHPSVPPQFVLRNEADGDEHRVFAGGELDLATAPCLEDALLAAERADAKRITLDLGGLTFMDSAGIHLLLRARTRSRANGSGLQLKPAPPSVQSLLALVGLEGQLDVDDHASDVFNVAQDGRRVSA